MSKRTYTYDYARPALATDCVIFGFDEGELKLLLIEREKEPFKNMWTLPGGFVDVKETTNECALRILQEKTGLKNVFIEQLYTFSELNRDPRERVVAVSYYALVNKRQYEIVAGRDTVSVQWFPINDLPKLGFDHGKIVKLALERLKGKVRYQPIGFELLNKKFTLTQLQHLYEAILETSIDKRNFRKKILGMGLLEQLDEKEQNVAHKAAYYYSFDHKTYKQLSQSGFLFEL
ncbi:MAG TPA: NUDIX domain-containing protein [Flavobacteriales bacterium]|nr:NUDIX domain-containing protein [Flavobacteriales bacterium]